MDDLLFLARQDSGMVQLHRQDCPLDALLMEVVDEQTAIAQSKQITLNLNLGNPDETVIPGEEPFTMQGDYDQLSRLFTNLVSNAIQYSPSAGNITLNLIQQLQQNQAFLLASVEDEGPGIPAEAIPRLFDRFYRVDSARQRQFELTPKNPRSSKGGTGLGLAIAQAIAQGHQGMIKARKSQRKRHEVYSQAAPEQDCYIASKQLTDHKSLSQ